MNNTNENWLRERKTYIGGSDIAAICGFSSYKSPLELYLEKTSDDIIDSNKKNKEEIERGHRQEEFIAQEYAKRTGFNVEIESGLIRHPDYPFIAANIDRWANDRKHILECKSLLHWMVYSEKGKDIPDYYLCQVAYYVGICYRLYGITKADIAVEIGEDIKNIDGTSFWKPRDFIIYTYERNPDFENNLFKMAKHFWNEHIVNRVPPECTNISDAKQLYNNGDGSSIHANDNIIDKVRQLKELKMQEKVIEQKIKSTQLEIQVFMKNSEILLGNDNSILATWKNSSPKTVVDFKKLQEEHSDLYFQYTKENKGSRTFLIK